jgi:glycosyltransferase involved in cell wall biosynthesis
MASISVVICTHNRAGYLRRALESLAVQTLPSGDYEVIVVDNACTDETPQVAQAMAATVPNLRYIREERLGLSRARNTGAEVASAAYVAYLDDDARAEPQWADRILQAFREVGPTPACVGGRVWMDWGGNAPSWLPRRYWSLYTHLDLGDKDHILGDAEYLVGANMAFRREVLLDLGGFDERLGRHGGKLLSGEEAAVIQQLRERGLPIYYVAAAAVWHAVPEVRRHRRWLWARLFWDGASQPLLDGCRGQSRRFYVDQAYRDLRRMGFFSLHWLGALVRGNRDQSLDSALSLLQRMGRLRTHILLVWSASGVHKVR